MKIINRPRLIFAFFMYSGHPCLSFDTIDDGLGDKRNDYPMSCFIVAGTQAEKIRDNGIIVLKLENLTKNKQSLFK